MGWMHTLWYLSISKALGWWQKMPLPRWGQSQTCSCLRRVFVKCLSGSTRWGLVNLPHWKLWPFQQNCSNSVDMVWSPNECSFVELNRQPSTERIWLAFSIHKSLCPGKIHYIWLKGLFTIFFYRSNLIFWIVMGCGIADFGRRGL